MKYILAAMILVVLVAGCTAPTPDPGAIQTAIAQTQVAIPSATSTEIPTDTSTPAPTNTLAPSNTPRPTNTSRPAATIEPTSVSEIDLTRAKAKNNVASQDEGGVIIEISRIIVADYDAVPLLEELEEDSIFRGNITLVEFIFKIVNNTDRVVRVRAHDANVAINGEQINLLDYLYEGTEFGDSLGGEMLPGVTKIGGLWVGLSRTQWNEVSTIIISIDYPYTTDYDRLGGDYLFNIEVGDWGFEPLPEGLLVD